MDRKFFAETVGWIGIILILFAYFLVSYGFVLANSFSYQFLNLIAVFGTFYNAYYNKSKPIMTLQLVWGIIALVAIIKIYF